MIKNEAPGLPRILSMREYTARAQGKIRLAEALDVVRFDVYEGYLDEELDHLRSQASARRSC